VSCKGVALSRIGGSQQSSSDPGGREWRLRERERDRVGEAGRARSVLATHPIRVMAPNVRKNTAHKESSREKPHVHRAKFNGRP
jgi:hypothetical protein